MSLVYFSVVTHNTDCTDISYIHPPPQWSRRRRRRGQKRWPRESRRAWPAQQGGRRRSRSLTRHRAGRHVRHCSGQSKKYIIHTGGLFGEKPGFSNWRQPAVIAESREGSTNTENPRLRIYFFLSTICLCLYWKYAANEFRWHWSLYMVIFFFSEKSFSCPSNIHIVL